MKPASTALAALINSAAFISFDLYTITTTVGLVIRLTTADFDVLDLSANLYHCGTMDSGYPRIDLKGSRVQGHWKRGLDSDKWTVAILPQVVDPRSGVFTYPDVAGSTPWLASCRAGLFDNADVVVSRAYFASAPLPPLSIASRTCVGTISIFRGLVATVDCDQSSSLFTITDYKSLLDITMPRNIYQSSCRHQLFDAGCTLVAATYAKTAAALTGSTQAVILGSPAAPAGSGTWQLGRIVFSSGLNALFQRTIAAWDGAHAFTLQYPFPFAVSAGDAFTIYPGCDKQLSTCQAFANQTNFGGEPFIPTPEVTLGG